MSEFITFEILATYGGAVGMVAVITQMIKGVGVIQKVPTQLVSYVLSAAILYVAYFFTGQMTVSNAALILFNAVLVSLGANGGYDAVHRIGGK